MSHPNSKTLMDTGHYNCRDYAFSPHFAPTTYTSGFHLHHLHPNQSHSQSYSQSQSQNINQQSRFRHESFAELEARSRSPASQGPRFPLLDLPVELRRQILQYLLPYTQELQETRPGARARDGTPRQRKPQPRDDVSSLQSPTQLFPHNTRPGSGTKPRPTPTQSAPTTTNPHPKPKTHSIIWRRGNIRLLSVCRQLHDECAAQIYSENIFLLFISYAEVKFRFHWLLPSGVVPRREYPFLDCLPQRYMRLVKRVMVNVDFVDGYTAMVKFNVGEKGLVAGLRNRVGSLVLALRPCGGEKEEEGREEERMARISIRVSNSNGVMDAWKSEASRHRDGESRMQADVETILEPFGRFRNVRMVDVSGAVEEEFAAALEAKMKSAEPRDLAMERVTFVDEGLAAIRRHGVPLCVYGNDI